MASLLGAFLLSALFCLYLSVVCWLKKYETCAMSFTHGDTEGKYESAENLSRFTSELSNATASTPGSSNVACYPLNSNHMMRGIERTVLPNQRQDWRRRPLRFGGATMPTSERTTLSFVGPGQA